MHTTLTEVDGLLDGFAWAYRDQVARFPVRPARWQPVHTVYLPADRVTAGTVTDWGNSATDLLRRYLGTPAHLAAVFELSSPQAEAVHERLRWKLATEPIEDLRVDFEDGYGVRPPDEEERHVESAAAAVAGLHAAGKLPRRWGIRVRSFADGDPRRSVRTLDGFLTEVMARAGRLPEGFVVTFPKVLMEEYLRQFARCLEALESSLRLEPNTLGFEMQVEAPQTVLLLWRSADLVPSLGGRLTAAHFGVFDYTAAIGLPPYEQRLDHPACDLARDAMRTAFAGTGVELSDGSLAAAPASDAAGDVHTVLRRHAALVRHSLANGFYQGWDMHPSHLVSRFATVYAFYLARYDDYRERVRAWEQGQAAAGGELDEPATIATLAAALARADQALPPAAGDARRTAGSR